MASQPVLLYSPVVGDAEGGAPENGELAQQSPRPHRSLRVGVLATVATVVVLAVAAVPLPLPLGETKRPAGTTSLARWMVSLASSTNSSHLSEECQSDFAKVDAELVETYMDYKAACNGTTNFSSASEDCLTAARDAVEHHQRRERFKQGICTDEEHRLCNITLTVAGIESSLGQCWPKVCKPKNLLLEYLEGWNVATNKSTVSDVEGTFMLACEDHDVLTKDVLVPDIFEGGLNPPGRSIMSALAIIVIVQGAKLL